MARRGRQPLVELSLLLGRKPRAIQAHGPAGCLIVGRVCVHAPIAPLGRGPAQLRSSLRVPSPARAPAAFQPRFRSPLVARPPAGPSALRASAARRPAATAVGALPELYAPARARLQRSRAARDPAPH